jgi:hypothetical protein
VGGLLKLEKMCGVGRWVGIRSRRRKICVYEYVYEYGKKSSENGLPTYSYTHSYTRISSRSQSWLPVRCLPPDKLQSPAQPG